MEFIESSAKMGINVHEAFIQIGKSIKDELMKE
jgi:hypothetical protein